jgi:hypothetical protein
MSRAKADMNRIRRLGAIWKRVDGLEKYLSALIG